ncbi:hypothetical protein EJ08DRAFT_663066 [Tothia fuscella]|uniref:Uncharacterized protein n=1 Tax=Tothia fuscella TaxID=1048955 RepID=A0A9P4NLR1_9PEZI|nr:hypothetical protein EJ08DRAFT_663066 [Tothia fuscella]
MDLYTPSDSPDELSLDFVPKEKVRRRRRKEAQAPLNLRTSPQERQPRKRTRTERDWEYYSDTPTTTSESSRESSPGFAPAVPADIRIKSHRHRNRLRNSGPHSTPQRKRTKLQLKAIQETREPYYSNESDNYVPDSTDSDSELASAAGSSTSNSLETDFWYTIRKVATPPPLPQPPNDTRPYPRERYISPSPPPSPYEQLIADFEPEPQTPPPQTPPPHQASPETPQSPRVLKFSEQEPQVRPTRLLAIKRPPKVSAELRKRSLPSPLIRPYSRNPQKHFTKPQL